MFNSGQQIGTTSKSLAYIVFMIALLARLIHVFEISQTKPYYLTLQVDATAYDLWGQEIASGDIVGKETFYQDPLYPYFLGLIYSIFGHNLTIVIILQAVIGAFSSLFLFYIARYLVNQYVGVIAAILWSFHSPIIFYEALIQKEGISVFLAILSVYLFLVAEESRYYKYSFLGGLFIALAVLTRGNMLLVIPFVFLWMAFKFRKSSFGFICTTLLGLLVVFLPVAVRNKIVGGEFVLTTAQAGANFYWGNNEYASGSLLPPPRFVRTNPKYERKDFEEEAMRITGRKMTSAEVSKFWFKKGIDFIVKHPAQYLWLEYQKFLLLFNGQETSDNAYQYYYYERFSSVLKYSPVTYWLISSLGLLGMVLSINNWKRLSILYLFIITYSLSLLIFFVMSRYRLQLAPFLTTFAAASLYWGWQKIKAKEYAAFLFGIILLLLFSFFTGKDIEWLSTLNKREVLFKEIITDAEEKEAKGDYRNAIIRYKELTELSNSDIPHIRLGNIYYKQKRFNEAIDEYKKVLEAKVNIGLVHFKIGVVLIDMNNINEAIKEFQLSVMSDPEQLGSYFELARAFERKGMLDESLKYWNELLKRDRTGKWTSVAQTKISELRRKH